MNSKTETSEVNIVETEKIELNKPLVVLGFAGPGLVGGIAVTHIIEQLKMKKIAHVRSRYLPPAVVFIDGKLRNPFRIYSNEEGTFCAIVCELPFPSDGLYQIASTLLDWIEEKGVKELVVLDGVGVQGVPKRRETFCAAEDEKCKCCEEKGVKKMTGGVIYGIAGSILNECLQRKILGVAFLTHAITFMPDPEGAAALIQALNSVYNLKVGTEELSKKAEEIKQKLKEVAEQHQAMRKAEEVRGLPDRVYI